MFLSTLLFYIANCMMQLVCYNMVNFSKLLQYYFNSVIDHIKSKGYFTIKDILHLFFK